MKGCTNMHPWVKAQGKTLARRIVRPAVCLFVAVSSPAAEIGRVCDRNGLLLMEVERLADGKFRKHFPLKAFAVHLLESLKGPASGETIYLTLDAKVQMSAEKALRSVGRGSVVIADPKTGDILAMASVPSFDREAIDKDYWAILNADDTDPLLNRAAMTYVPGASYFPIVFLAGAAQTLAGFEHTCTGSVKLWDEERVVTCPVAHGKLDREAALGVSCNTYFYSLGETVGSEAIRKMAEYLGYGEKSGLPIGDGAGQVHAEIKYLWVRYPTPEVASMKVGLDVILTTPLQTVVLASALANSGEFLPLRLLDRIERRNGMIEQIPVANFRRLSERGISAKDIAVIRNAMFALVGKRDGDGSGGAVSAYRVAGIESSMPRKWKGEPDRVESFSGFAESKEKSYAFSVWIEGAVLSGKVAVPIASRILSALDQSKPEPVQPASDSLQFLESVP